MQRASWPPNRTECCRHRKCRRKPPAYSTWLADARFVERASSRNALFRLSFASMLACQNDPSQEPTLFTLTQAYSIRYGRVLSARLSFHPPGIEDPVSRCAYKHHATTQDG